MRTLIQEKLNELSDIESSEPISDDIVENQKTYFGYELSTTYVNSDFQNNYTYRTSITGHVIRKRLTTENTLEIVDLAVQNIVNKLKELNFKCSFQDVSIENGIKKVKVTGYVQHNELNKKLIV